ncbi:MAG: phosphoglycerate kinase [Candidatus Neptunochlamydia sp.]|nr:phosphoglycerate kinase [Candidatus Neptunochlamydia sp.]
MDKLSLQDLDIHGKKVLMRVDFNVPLDEHGAISDDTRIVLTLPSIQYILAQGGRLILMSHFGRPKAEVNPEFSLKPCREQLSILLEQDVQFSPDCTGEETIKLAESLKPGEVLLLENLRFQEGEEHPEKDPSFAKALASLGEIYVDDAFGAAHHSHASTVTITEYFPKKCAMGFLMEKEISYLSKVVLNPKRPFYAIIGGAKIGSKIGVLNTLRQKVDTIFIGGGMVFTFLKAKDIPIGDSICDDEKLDEAKQFLKNCEKQAIQVHLSIDIVITNETETQIIYVKEGIPDGWKGMDVGPQTVETWSDDLKKGATIFWNGPIGVFEEPVFAHGTNRLAQNLSMMQGEVIVGGGDSIAAINKLQLQKSFAHLSSGGGASLEFIENGTLPGIEALTNK